MKGYAMPGYRGHISGAFFLYSILLILLLSFYYIKPVWALQWLIAIILGALFPDIDTKSKGQKIFYTCLFIILGFCFLGHCYRFASLLGIVSAIPLMVNHRGIFHRWWFLFFITSSTAYTLISYFPSYTDSIIINALFFFVGAISHIWMDMGFKKMIKIKP